MPLNAVIMDIFYKIKIIYFIYSIIKKDYKHFFKRLDINFINMPNDKQRGLKRKKDNLTPAFKALLDDLEEEEWQIVTFELYDENE